VNDARHSVWLKSSGRELSAFDHYSGQSVLQLGNAGIGDVGLVDAKRFETFQDRQVCEASVADACNAQVENFEFPEISQVPAWKRKPRPIFSAGVFG
jgi:hypothetical protein